MKKVKVFSLTLIFIFALTMLTGCYYDPPEGYTKNHHSYEDALEFAKSIDPNAEVEKEYHMDEINYREAKVWRAEINGISCNIASKEERVYNSGIGAGEFCRTYYALKTDYGEGALAKILEENDLWYTEWCMQGIGTNYIFARYYYRNGILNELSNEEFDVLWENAIAVKSEYNITGAKTEMRFSLVAPEKFSDGTVKISTISFDPEKDDKANIIERYHQRWQLELTE